MKIARIILAGLVSLGLTTSFAGFAEAQPQKTGTIVGTVESCGNEDGTLVFIPGRSFVVITDSSGSFELSSVPTGTHTVRIESPGGLDTAVPSVVVNQNKTTDLHTITLIDLQTNINNCGTCGNVCPAGSNSISACTAGQCQLAACSSGFGNCDGNPVNGCETDLQTSVANCGSCGTACSFDNGIPACTAGLCQLVACGSGFGNCDGNPANGCETNLLTTSNCGICGNACSAGQACTAGVCVSLP